jgi:hypothetical protein
MVAGYIPVYRTQQVCVMEVVTVLRYGKYAEGECSDVGHVLA